MLESISASEDYDMADASSHHARTEPAGRRAFATVMFTAENLPSPITPEQLDAARRVIETEVHRLKPRLRAADDTDPTESPAGGEHVLRATVNPNGGVHAQT